MVELPEQCKELQNMSPEEEIANLRMEYEKTQDMAIHFDLLNWTIGSILIAGVFVMIGIVGEKKQVYPYLAVFSFIALLVWRLYYKRHRDIQMVKYRRLHCIEKKLKLQQHLNVETDDDTIEEKRIFGIKIKVKKLFGIKGNDCANILTVGIPVTLIVAYLGPTIFTVGIPSTVLVAYLIWRYKC